MNTIRELKQQEKYKNMLKRKNREKNIYKDKNSSLRIEKMNLIKCVERKDKEIERLNNIINELEKFLKDKIDRWGDDEIVKDTIYHERLAVRLIYDYLQTLKGDGSNEKTTDNGI